MTYFSKKMKSPVGTLTLVASPTHLVAVLWENDQRIFFAPLKTLQDHPILLKAEAQLKDYFKGSRTTFDLPLHFDGTEFQNSVWSALKTIPYGETKSYMDIARKIKSPKACRAVGAANGKNPLSIVVPCHRVIGANGTLTGFAGGLDAKKLLLAHEASRLNQRAIQ